MEKQTFTFQNGKTKTIVNVYYEKLPTREQLEEPFRQYLIQAEKDKMKNAPGANRSI